MRGSQRRRPLWRPPPSRGFPNCGNRRTLGADKPRQRHAARLMGQGRAAPIPWTQPWGRCSLYKHSARSIVGGAACISAAPAPLFAAQPSKVFCRAFFQKSGAQPAKVFWHTFFSKNPESGALAKSTPAARRLSWILLGAGGVPKQALAACGPRFL